MAKFIINSTSTAAVRKDEVTALTIAQTGPDKFTLDVRTIRETLLLPGIGFEDGATLAEVQGKAAAILAALEE